MNKVDATIMEYQAFLIYKLSINTRNAYIKKMVYKFNYNGNNYIFQQTMAKTRYRMMFILWNLGYIIFS